MARKSGNSLLSPLGALGSKGQSLPEFLIAVPVFLFLILLIFQVILIYRAKNILDYAAFEAARTGAVNSANVDAMIRGLATGLAPLYATDAGNVAPLPLPGAPPPDSAEALCSSDDYPDVADSAWCRAYTDIMLNANIQIISPTTEAMDIHGEEQYDGRVAIPNDNLAYRTRDPNNESGVNVQDANILKIKVDYDFPLIVPFVDRVVRGESKYFKDDPDTDTDLKQPLVDRFFRIPLQSHAVVRMQSPIYEDDSDAPLPSLEDLL